MKDSFPLVANTVKTCGRAGRRILCCAIYKFGNAHTHTHTHTHTPYFRFIV